MVEAKIIIETRKTTTKENSISTNHQTIEITGKYYEKNLGKSQKLN